MIPLPCEENIYVRHYYSSAQGGKGEYYTEPVMSQKQARQLTVDVSRQSNVYDEPLLADSSSFPPPPPLKMLTLPPEPFQASCSSAPATTTLPAPPSALPGAVQPLTPTLQVPPPPLPVQPPTSAPPQPSTSTSPIPSWTRSNLPPPPAPPQQMTTFKSTFDRPLPSVQAEIKTPVSKNKNGKGSKTKQTQRSHKVNPLYAGIKSEEKEKGKRSKKVNPLYSSTSSKAKAKSKASKEPKANPLYGDFRDELQSKLQSRADPTNSAS